MPVSSWSLTASSNATADPSINWQEGQLPSTVNDSARAMMAAGRAWVSDLAGSVTLGGSANVITIASNQPATALSSNVVGFFAASTNTGAVTLNVDGLGAKNLVTANGTALIAGQIIAGSYYLAAYNATNDNWVLLGARDAPKLATYFVTSDIVLGGLGEVKEWLRSDLPAGGGWAWANGQALSRATYSALFAKIGTTYGAGDGSTTFNVVDKCGRAAFGLDNMGGITAKGRLTSTTVNPNATTLGFTGGAQLITLDITQIPSHAHGVSDLGHNHVVTDPGHNHAVNRSTGGGGPFFTLFGGQFQAGDGGTYSATTGINLGNAFSNITVQANGGGTAHNNLPPAVGVNFIVCHGVYN